MKKIPLTQNKFALVDDADYTELSKIKWSAYGVKKSNLLYAVTGARHKKQKMHSFIMKPKKGFCVDHINGNGLDNRRRNLRVCTLSENLCNKKIYKQNKSGFKGVHFALRQNKWKSQIQYKYKKYHLGYFESAELAHKVYCIASKELHGEFGRTN